MIPVTALPDGDDTRLFDRLVVAQAAGVFHPHPPMTYATEGEVLKVGSVLGVVVSLGQEVEVTSFCTGYLKGVLAESGERVRVGQPLAWLQANDGSHPPAVA